MQIVCVIKLIYQLIDQVPTDQPINRPVKCMFL